MILDDIFYKKGPSIVITILYTVGILGFYIPWSRNIFIQLTPFTLLLSAIVLVLYHDSKSPVFYLTSSIIVIAGYIVELIGVHTGIPFGTYTYGRGLGWKVFEVPPMIGVNWFLMVYLSSYVTNQIIPKKNRLALKSFVAAAIMVLLDLIIEPFAIKFDLWDWEGGPVPLSNYLAWFVIGFLFQLVWNHYSEIGKAKNQVANTLFFCFLLFFSLLLFA